MDFSITIINPVTEYQDGSYTMVILPKEIDSAVLEQLFGQLPEVPELGFSKPKLFRLSNNRHTTHPMTLHSFEGTWRIGGYDTPFDLDLQYAHSLAAVIVDLHNQYVMSRGLQKSTYEEWVNGEVGNFGSFHTAILEAYKLADGNNRIKLEQVYPEWFVAPRQLIPNFFSTKK